MKAKRSLEMMTAPAAIGKMAVRAMLWNQKPKF